MSKEPRDSMVRPPSEGNVYSHATPSTAALRPEGNVYSRATPSTGALRQDGNVYRLATSIVALRQEVQVHSCDYTRMPSVLLSHLNSRIFHEKILSPFGTRFSGVPQRSSFHSISQRCRIGQKRHPRFLRRAAAFALIAD